MPWNKKSEFHQRYKFIQQTRARGASIAGLCTQFRISRKTAYKWLRRYRQKGWRGLQNRPPVARKPPHKIGMKWRRRVRRWRRRHRSWGPRKLHHWLKLRHGARGLPAPATLGRWLRSWGLVGARRLRRPPGPKVRRPARPPVRAANDIWTADFKGWFRLGDGTHVEPLTVRDGCSRYTLTVHLLRQQNVAATLPVFRRLFRRYGRPRAIRVDNGSPFGSKGPRGWTRLSAWWVRQGIAVEFIRPGHPEDNGGHEQFHRVLKAETATPPAQTWRGQQRRTQHWVRQYNEQRPHEALGMKVPAQWYRPRRRVWTEHPPPLRYPQQWETRQVKTNGEISWRGRPRFIAESLAGEKIGLQKMRSERWRVYFGSWLMGELHAHERSGMRPVVYRTKHARAKV